MEPQTRYAKSISDSEIMASKVSFQISAAAEAAVPLSGPFGSTAAPSNLPAIPSNFLFNPEICSANQASNLLVRH